MALLTALLATDLEPSLSLPVSAAGREHSPPALRSVWKVGVANARPRGRDSESQPSGHGPLGSEPRARVVDRCERMCGMVRSLLSSFLALSPRPNASITLRKHGHGVGPQRWHCSDFCGPFQPG